MKKLVFIFFLLMPAAVVIAQDKKGNYTASNGITYKVGDTIKLGRGSATNGDFLYLQMGGWAALASYNSKSGSDQFNVGKGYSHTNVVIKKIKSGRLKGSVKYYFVVAGGNITNYNLMIEDAISTGEIFDSKKTPTEVIVISDNIDKIKRLKELLDSGAITQDEYEAQKKKLLQ